MLHLRFKIFVFIAIFTFSSLLLIFIYKFTLLKPFGHLIRQQTEEKCNHSLDISKIIWESRRGRREKFLQETMLRNETKIILLYTTLFFHQWWNSVSEIDLHDYTATHNCKTQDCYLTYDKKVLPFADAVVFYAVDMSNQNEYSASCLHLLSRYRPITQRWIFYMHESPAHTINLEPYNGLFNWTMTFMRSSDIFVPYFYHRKIGSNDKRPEKDVNYARGKSRVAAWVVSNCGLLRDQYALELEKYIDLTVYGGCGYKFKNNGEICSRWASRCEAELKKYKFYLAFENCFCEDYITEKYFDKGLRFGLVPIVIGPNYNTSLTIPGSYIDASEFQSVQDLAKHINYLDKNDTAYNEYFKWKQEYVVTDGLDYICEMCGALHDRSRPDKVYHDLSIYWSKENACSIYDWKIKQLQMQIAKSRFKYN